MGKRIPIQIGSEIFDSKKKAKDFIRDIVDRYTDGQLISGLDDTFLRDLILLHPESETKVGGGLSHFSIALDQEWKKTRHFVLFRTNGTSTDFSWHTCIDGTDDRQDRYSALRHAVADQVIAFKISCFASEIAPMCYYLKTTLTEIEAHVDHEAPFTFHFLANRWLSKSGIKIDNLELVDNADNQLIRTLRHQDQIRSWRKFHRNEARLRIISKRANLSHARAKLPRN